MSRRLRVFISSTMTDLSNERDAICRKLNDFNFEVVNAEALLPNGFCSWDKISKEIKSCDIFILIIGERYGWIPDTGVKSELGLSVTHLEYIEAKALGIPILPFLKELQYGVDSTKEDSKRRDEFRDEVKKWDNGHFISNFRLAYDLSENVGKAIIDLLSDEFQNNKIRERAQCVSDTTISLKNDSLIRNTNEFEAIPSELLMRIKRKEVVLFAGAGISLSAGLPSAAAFSEKIAQVIRESNPDYSINRVGSVFAGIASDAENIKGRKFLLEAVSSLIQPPQGIEPSRAHIEAVQLFSQIITTNYDTLFEEAAKMKGINLNLISDNKEGNDLPENMMVKLHGSYEKPDTLVLTEREVLMLDKKKGDLWKAIIKLLKNKMILVVGTSLRDPSVIRLFSEVDSISGYFVTPEVYGFTQELMNQWNLKCINADADSFFRVLAKDIDYTCL